MCGGDDVYVEQPKPSQAEQDLMAQQTALLEQQQEFYGQVFPLLLAEGGYEYDSDPITGEVTLQQSPGYQNLQEAQLQLAQTAADLNQQILEGQISQQDAQQQYQQTQLALSQQGLEYNQAMMGYMQDYLPQQAELAQTAMDLNQRVVEGQLSMQDAQLEYQKESLEMASATQKALLGYLNKPKSALEQRMEEVGLLQADYIEKALKGELPVSEATMQTEEEERAQLAESLSRKMGSNWQTTTAGIQAMSEFDQRWEVIKDAERRGTIQSGMGSLISGAGVAEGTNAQQFQQLLGLAGQYGGSGSSSMVNAGLGGLLSTPMYSSGLANVASPYSGLGSAASGISSGYGNLMSGYGQALQPYQYYSGLGLQANMANAQMAAQGSSGLWGGIGSILGNIGGGLFGFGGMFGQKI